MRVSFLGPEGTFSHEFAKGQWPTAVLMPQIPMPAVVSAVADRSCDCGVLPFFNDNTKSVIVAQNALYQARGQVFVRELMAHDVRHCIYSHGQLHEIEEIRSMGAVFPQVSNWLQSNRIRAKQTHTDSTAAAVRDINRLKDKRIAAIGARIAGDYYKSVPIIATDIQNVPNQTIFAVLCGQAPQPDHFDYLLFSGQGVSTSDAFRISEVAVDRGFRIGIPLTFHPMMILDIDIRRKTDSMPRQSIGQFIDEMHRANTPFRYIGGHLRTSLTNLIESSKRKANPQSQ